MSVCVHVWSQVSWLLLKLHSVACLCNTQTHTQWVNSADWDHTQNILNTDFTNFNQVLLIRSWSQTTAHSPKTASYSRAVSVTINELSKDVSEWTSRRIVLKHVFEGKSTLLNIKNGIEFGSFKNNCPNKCPYLFQDGCWFIASRWSGLIRLKWISWLSAIHF